MLITSDEYLDKVTQTQNTLFQALLTFADGTTQTITGDDVDLGSATFSDAVSSTGSFDIGAAIVSQFLLTLNNRDRRFDTFRFGGAQIIPYVGVELDSGEVEWLIKGYYYIEQPQSYGSTIRLTCYDSLKLFEREYSKVKTQYPATIGQIIADMCEACGVTLLTKTFPHYDYVVNERPTDEGATCLEMLGYAAQVAGCFVDADQLGRLRVRWYDGTAFVNESGLDGGSFATSTTPYSDGDTAFGGWFMYDGDTFNGGAAFSYAYVDVTAIRGYTVNTDDKVFTGLQVSAASNGTDQGEQYLAGVDGYIAKIENNPLVEYGRAQEVAEMLSGSIVGMTFRPLQVEQVGDPTIEAGDAVQVVDRLARVYRTWATQVDYSLTGTTRISCFAAEESTVQLKQRRTVNEIITDKVREETINNIDKVIPTIIERQLPDIISSNPQIQEQITGIVTPSIPTISNVPVITGPDGIEYTIGIDENGNLVAVPFLSSIAVTQQPDKTSYKYGEALDFTGIIVTAYNADGSEWGVVPFEELSFDPMTAPLQRDFIARSDSILWNSGVVSENNGTRTPVRKAHDGACAGIISTNALGDIFGGNWIGVAILATSAEAARLSVTQSRLSSVSVDGVTLYVGFAATNSNWGGGTTFTNPHGLPVVNTKLCEVNANFTEQEVRNLMKLLSFTPVTNGGLITVNWPNPYDGEILSTTFAITVDESGWIDRVIDTVQGAIDSNS